MSTSSSEVDIAIIGAGAAGIAAARHLADSHPGLSLQVLEAGRQAGGRARTVMAGGFPLDLGCGWLHGARDNAWRAVAERDGYALDRALSPWDGAGRSLGLDPADSADAEAALGRFFERAETLAKDGADRAFDEALAPGCRWNGFIGAVGTYINGVELDRASLIDFDRYEPGRGPDCRVVAGYGTLVAHTAENLPVAFGTVVQRIDHRGSTITLDTDQGTVRARAVIVTVPSDALAGEALRFDPPLPDKIEAAAALPLGLCNKLFLRIPDDVVLPEETHRLGSALTVRTASYHVRPFGRPVIECYFGGELARMVDGDRAAALAFAQEELARAYGTDVASRLTVVALSAWAAEPHIHGAYSYAKPGGADARTKLAQPVDGRLFFAGEATSAGRFSTAHGAFETGVAAAEAAMASVR